MRVGHDLRWRITSKHLHLGAWFGPGEDGRVQLCTTSFVEVSERVNNIRLKIQAVLISGRAAYIPHTGRCIAYEGGQ